MTTEARSTNLDRSWTWAQLVQAEPELAALYRIVPRTVRMYLLPGRSDLADVVAFVEKFSQRWYEARTQYAITRAITDTMDFLVGWHCHRPELKTTQAYDAAYQKVTDLLDAEELKVKAEVDAWLARRPPAEDGAAWQAWLLDRPAFDFDRADGRSS